MTTTPNLAAGKPTLAALFHHEAAPGVLLAIAAVIALIADNSLFAGLYDRLLLAFVSVTVEDVGIEKPLLLWINDGLMAIFFFLVGLEIKREVIQGKLSSLRAASLPAFGAIGGMAVPALIYVALNAATPETLGGWAIPAATDIAFALGALALVGSRAPAGLKIFLLALAVLDDLGAIVVIALFYTANLSLGALGIAAAGFAVLLAMNLLGVKRIGLYIVVGLVIWVAVLKSGVHATLAGVVVAFTLPLRGKEGEFREGGSPLEVLEHVLHPWVAFMILPLFAFANAGVPLAGMSVSDLFAPVPLGIAAGLVVGKPIGILGACWIAVRLGWANLPDGVNWLKLYGVSQLAGIGFTMSLFIGTLAFSDPALQSAVRIGVLGGTIVSIVLGMTALAWALKDQSPSTDTRAATPAEAGHD
ncbi:Na+/H+ antiporter NhaA [Thalassobaculum sp. OXR-137]|uniref:Na+/H+ antiporter NhaA n=1 Tax=Thalassobaculum sp. OXR-137 TaxID=3100173 RepID=UPI002AC98E7A|nr:Na+/H+ antiporter NhaA [Thalassobaculum sp. OXR-137]WPZ33433.1 Na+/H+ antiporter NhaA [Thalassobaculum sp. OXR-137]